MNTNYKIFPAVLAVNKEYELTITRKYFALLPNQNFIIELTAMERGKIEDYPLYNNKKTIPVKSDGSGKIHVKIICDSEQEYCIRVLSARMRYLGKGAVYAVKEDLTGLYPFRGDCHIHTRRSDGHFKPATVCSVYRRLGYDFMTVSDHERYFPSLEAINYFKKVPTDLNVVPGEEVHMPFTDIHIVNFGGKFSINALRKNSQHGKQHKLDPKYRSIDGNCHPLLSDEEYENELKAIEETLTDIPDNVPKRSYAVVVWIHQKIKQAEGLSVFAHPYWINYVYQVPPVYYDYLMKTQPFDAYEVLGGECYYEMNGFQTAQYHLDREHGLRYPIVGDTDSHFCFNVRKWRPNPASHVASTVVLAKENTREAIIDGIKSFRSVALDTMDKHWRIVGDVRLTKYVQFLVSQYMPMQLRIARTEGRFLLAHRALRVFKPVLNKLKGRTNALQKKFFGF